MVNYDTPEDLELFIDKLDVLRQRTVLSKITNAKLNHLRENKRNQREVDQIEYNMRMRVFAKQLKDIYESQKQESQTDVKGATIVEFAEQFLTELAQNQKEEKGMSR